MELAVHSYGLVGFEPEVGLQLLNTLGIRAIELACAGVFTDRRYGEPTVLLEDRRAYAGWRDLYARNAVEIRALSLHGEPLSPSTDVAATYAREFHAACRFAEKIGVRRLSLKAGLPEGAPGDRSPCWIAAYPPEFPNRRRDALQWQWEERLIPYWVTHAALAEDYGCELAFEMQAWDMVYNPRTLLELRGAVGPTVRCNFDPSHMWYQGADPLAAADALAGVISTVHAKDTRLAIERTSRNGLLDINPQTALAERVWTFATPGTGHDAKVWTGLFECLRTGGYEGEIAIEHEDPNVAAGDGIEQATRFLRPLLAGGEHVVNSGAPGSNRES